MNYAILTRTGLHITAITAGPKNNDENGDKAKTQVLCGYGRKRLLDDKAGSLS